MILSKIHRPVHRGSDQLKTVLELYDMEINRTLSMPDYQKIEDNGGRET